MSGPRRACVVRLGGREPHLSQIAAGFTLLHQQKELFVRFGGFLPEGAYPHARVLRAEFDDGMVLFYDLAEALRRSPGRPSMPAWKALLSASNAALILQTTRACVTGQKSSPWA